MLLLSLIILVGACKNSGEKNEPSSDTKIILTLEDFYSNPDNYLNQEVTIQGLVTHVCKHGGQKLFIASEGDLDPLRIDVGEDIPEFKIEMEGSEAEFTGLVQLMNEEFVAQAQAEHEEHHGEGTEEEGIHVMNKDKSYHIVAKSFKSL